MFDVAVKSNFSNDVFSFVRTNVYENIDDACRTRPEVYFISQNLDLSFHAYKYDL